MILYQHQIPALFIWIGLATGLLVLLYSSWRYLKPDIPTLVGLGFRIAFLGLLTWCLFLPERKDTETHTLKPRFVVAIDISKSMLMTPQEGLVSNRWSDAQTVLRQSWKNMVGVDCDIDAYAFATEVGPRIDLAATDSLVPEGNATLLRESLTKIMDRYRGQNVAGVLLLSDGIDTKEAYDDWANEPWSWPVYTFSMEPVEAWEVEGDLRIDTVKTPRRVTVGWQTELRAVVSGQGTKGQPANVQLFRDSKLIQEIPTQIAAEGGSREVVFQLDHPEVGVFTYSVFVPPLPNETSTNDNSYAVSVQVVDARNRVLYVEGPPRWESKYLTRALKSNASITPLCFVRGPNQRFITYGARGNMTADMTAEQLAFFKIVIIGNLDAEELGESRAQNLLKFVDSGGSLVLLGGSKGWGPDGFLQTSLKKLVPVKKMSDTMTEAKYPVSLTDSGTGHPAFAGDSELWQIIPPVLSLFPDAALSAGAEALVAAQAPEGAQPIVVVQRYGQGKVVAILTDSLWRWQLSPNANKNNPYQRFWDQLISWLSPSEKELAPDQVELFADREQLYLGDELELSARVGIRRASGEEEKPDPASSSPVSCEIITPDERPLPYNMTRQNVVTPSGRSFPGFAVKFKAQQPGLHKAVATTEINGKKVVSEPVSFFVKPFTPESMPRPVNTTVLKNIARTSGGQYFDDLEALNEALSQLKPAGTEEESVQYSSLWQSVLIISCLMAFLSIEWAIRKWRNMP